MPDKIVTRREFLSTTAVTAGGAVLAGLGPASISAADALLETDPYNDKTVVRIYDPLVSSFVFAFPSPRIHSGAFAKEVASRGVEV